MPIKKQNLILKEGSYLEYIPDPLIGYQHARYKQKNVIRMEKGCYTPLLRYYYPWMVT